MQIHLDPDLQYRLYARMNISQKQPNLYIFRGKNQVSVPGSFKINTYGKPEDGESFYLQTRDTMHPAEVGTDTF
jgi:hypothetical protein